MFPLSSRARKGPGLKLASLLVLLVGLSIAAGIYFFAPEPDENAVLYEISLSKQYARTLQRLGGKQALLFDDIQQWLAARWRGKQLGVTIGWIAVAAAGIMFFVAKRRD